MVFMADVFVPCDDCGGKRFKPAVLDVRVNGKNIYEVLELTIDEAIRFFPREEKLGQALWQLQQVGLGYLRLGQPATTLSGGEAQRLKVARELVLTNKKSGQEALRDGRADDGPAPRRHSKARAGLRSPRRRRTHAGAHRAQHGRHQARGLGDRPRARRRAIAAARSWLRAARRRGAGRGLVYRTMAADGAPGICRVRGAPARRAPRRSARAAGGLSRLPVLSLGRADAALTSTPVSLLFVGLIPDSSVGRALDC